MVVTQCLPAVQNLSARQGSHDDTHKVSAVCKLQSLPLVSSGVSRASTCRCTQRCLYQMPQASLHAKSLMIDSKSLAPSCLQDAEGKQKEKAERLRFGRFFYRFPNGESGYGHLLSKCICYVWFVSADVG